MGILKLILVVAVVIIALIVLLSLMFGVDFMTMAYGIGLAGLILIGLLVAGTTIPDK